MAIFPNIEPQSFKETTSKNVFKSTFDTGYTQTRPKYTRQLKSFNFKYVALTLSQKTELENFIMNNQGLSFTYTHPITLDIYNVYNDSESIEFTFVNPSYYATEITLKEV